MLNQTCATCPFWTRLDADAAKLGGRGTCAKLDRVTRSHWTASTNCKSAA
jgi:hypothetical protein